MSYFDCYFEVDKIHNDTVSPLILSPLDNTLFQSIHVKQVYNLFSEHKSLKEQNVTQGTGLKEMVAKRMI
jgi:hypothetical protein